MSLRKRGTFGEKARTPTEPRDLLPAVRPIDLTANREWLLTHLRKVDRVTRITGAEIPALRKLPDFIAHIEYCATQVAEGIGALTAAEQAAERIGEAGTADATAARAELTQAIEAYADAINISQVLPHRQMVDLVRHEANRAERDRTGESWVRYRRRVATFRSALDELASACQVARVHSNLAGNLLGRAVPGETENEQCRQELDSLAEELTIQFVTLRQAMLAEAFSRADALNRRNLEAASDDAELPYRIGWGVVGEPGHAVLVLLGDDHDGLSNALADAASGTLQVIKDDSTPRGWLRISGCPDNFAVRLAENLTALQPDRISFAQFNGAAGTEVRVVPMRP